MSKDEIPDYMAQEKGDETALENQMEELGFADAEVLRITIVMNESNADRIVLDAVERELTAMYGGYTEFSDARGGWRTEKDTEETDSVRVVETVSSSGDDNSVYPVDREHTLSLINSIRDILGEDMVIADIKEIGSLASAGWGLNKMPPETRSNYVSRMMAELELKGTTTQEVENRIYQTYDPIEERE